MATWNTNYRMKSDKEANHGTVLRVKFIPDVRTSVDMAVPKILAFNFILILVV